MSGARERESGARADGEPDEYGVVGHPVAHSWSPFIHAAFARETRQALVYRAHDIAAERFSGFVREFAARGGRGLNVTVPHKRAAAELSAELTARATRAGAVNTLTFDRGRIRGDNTDGAGLITDLRANLAIRLAGARILLAGAGGAARGVLGPLLEADPALLVVANRAPERARALAGEFGSQGMTVRGCGFDELPPDPFDLVLNATAASLSGEVPAIPRAAVGPATICYDMAYAKTDTPFVSWSRECGCRRAVQGWGMLVEQAAESFEIWRGVRPSTAPVLELLAQRA
ncbi:MAG TPA: shikimate dehydrogenase [Steroidobacteraceae bacterium]|nr:shikimate dehydrogenase [Steroidobacteraceae bacterium]